MSRSQKGFAPVLILIIVALVLVGAFVFLKPKKGGPLKLLKRNPNSVSITQKSTGGEDWSEPTAFFNDYADPDIIQLDDGRFRMYFGDVPDYENFTHSVYSAISSDGEIFELEDGVRQAGASFPDVIKLPDSTYRMYFQGTSGILSSVSSDGLNWTQESGVRIVSANEMGLNITEVGATSTMQMQDGTYVMVYKAALEETYDPQAPNPGTSLLMWATSDDGIDFEKQGIAVDSRNELLNGWVDGPDFSSWEGTWKLYFWTYSGIYYVTFDGQEFSEPNLAILAAPDDDPMAKFAPLPPGDPTVINIDGIWYLYYGSYDPEENLETLYYVTLQ